MSGITVTVTNVAPVLAALKALRLEELDAPLTNVMQQMMADAQVYPPERSGQTYVRTYTLRDAWQQEGPTISGDTLAGALVNATPYAAYVMGEQQAWMHAGRWRTTEQIADAWESRIVDALEAAIARGMP